VIDLVIPSETSEAEMPDRFTYTLYDYPLFFNITGHIITVWLVMAVVVYTAWAIQRLAPKASKVAKVARFVYGMYVYNGMLRTVMQSSIYVYLG
jgi:hypothetical protein